MDLYRTSSNNLEVLRDLNKELGKKNLTEADHSRLVDQLITLYPHLKDNMEKYKKSVKSTRDAVRDLAQEQADSLTLSLPEMLKDIRSKVRVSSRGYLVTKAAEISAWISGRDIDTRYQLSYPTLKEKTEEAKQKSMSLSISEEERRKLQKKAQTGASVLKQIESQVKMLHTLDKSIEIAREGTKGLLQQQREDLAVELGAIYNISDVEGLLAELTATKPGTGKTKTGGGLSDREQAEANAKIRAYEGVAKTLRDFEYRSGQERIRAEIAAAKEAGKSVEEELKIHELNVIDIKEDLWKKVADLDTQAKILETNRTKLNESDYQKLLKQLNAARFTLVSDTHRKFESEEIRYQNRITEINEKRENDADKFISSLRKTREKDAKALHKETVQTLRAEGKIRRVWNADVEKIEEELADNIEGNPDAS